MTSVPRTVTTRSGTLSSADEATTIPSGYKQTEVGVIPEDWEVADLGSLTVLMTNGFVGTATRHYAKNDNGILYIQGYNVEENSFNFHGVKYVTEEFHRAHMKSCLRGGDLLTVQTGEVGLTTIVPESLAGSNCHALIISRFDQKHVSPAFISYFLNSKPGRSRLKLIETGTTMKHLNVGDVLQFSIPLPPTKAEQEAIAEALSDVDKLLESLEKLIAKKRAIKQAAMQQLLTGKTRLPGFSGEWETKRLEDIIDCLDHVRIPLNEAQRASMLGPYPYCGANGVLDYVNDFILDDDVILIAEDGGYFGEYVRRPIAYRMSGKIWVNNHAHIIRARPEYSQGFLYFSLVHKNILPYLASGTRAKLNKSEMNKIEVLLPLDNTEQKSIAAVLSDMDADIAALERRQDKARAIKQGMMQQLLTGRVRLVTPESDGKS